MANLAPWQVAWIAGQIWHDHDTVILATAISFAEDGSHDPSAIHVNGDGSRDLGLWQINEKAHPDLINNSAGWKWNDPQGNAKMAFNVWQSAGGKWTPWSTYNNGAYKLQMAAANQAFLDAIKQAVQMPTQTIWDQLSELALTGANGQSVADNISGTVSTINDLSSFFDAAGSFFGKLGDPKFWTSVGVILAGGIMLIIVAFHLLKSSKTVQKSASLAAKAVALA